MFRRVRTSFSACLAVVYFWSNAVAPQAAEANFWSERRRAVEAGGAPSPSLAELPPIRPQGPAVSSSPAVPPGLPAPISRKLSALLLALPAKAGAVSGVALPAGPVAGLVLHVHDVHEKLEAQKNIAAVVRAALAVDGGAGLIALEGSEGPMDFSRFRAFPHKESLRRAADFLLRKNMTSGPVHAVLTAPGAVPPVVGVDDAVLHAANVDAYRKTAARHDGDKWRLAAARRRLEREKPADFSPALLAFDRAASAHGAGRLPLGDYAELLSRTVTPGPETALFLSVRRLEKSLDFSLVEKERAAMIGALAAKISAGGLESLAADAAAYRAGRIKSSDYYRALADASRRAGAGVYPSLEAYVRYAAAADRLDGARLSREIDASERRAYALLAAAPEEKRLVGESRRLALAAALVDFVMTPEEWDEYRAGAATARQDVPDLSAYEAFYAAARARDRALAGNFLKAWRSAGRTDVPLAVLVTGGFHAHGVETALREAGWAVAAFSPALSSTEVKEPSSYLDSFNRPPTALESLGSPGEQLFVAKDARPDGRAAAVAVTGDAVLDGAVEAGAAEAAYKSLLPGTVPDQVSVEREGPAAVRFGITTPAGSASTQVRREGDSLDVTPLPSPAADLGRAAAAAARGASAMVPPVLAPVPRSAREVRRSKRSQGWGRKLKANKNDPYRRMRIDLGALARKGTPDARHAMDEVIHRYVFGDKGPKGGLSTAAPALWAEGEESSLREKMPTLARVLSDPAMTSRLLSVLSVLRLIHPYTVSMDDPSPPLAYAEKHGLVYHLGELSFTPVSESFRRHIFFVGNGAERRAVELKVPSEDLDRISPSESQFRLLQEFRAAHPRDPGVVRPVGFFRYGGVVPMYRGRRDFTQKPLVIQCTGYEDGKRISNVQRFPDFPRWADNPAGYADWMSDVLVHVIRLHRMSWLGTDPVGTDLHLENWRWVDGRAVNVGDYMAFTFVPSLSMEARRKETMLMMEKALGLSGDKLRPVFDRVVEKLSKDAGFGSPADVAREVAEEMALDGAPAPDSDGQAGWWALALTGFLPLNQNILHGHPGLQIALSLLLAFSPLIVVGVIGLPNPTARQKGEKGKELVSDYVLVLRAGGDEAAVRRELAALQSFEIFTASDGKIVFSEDVSLDFPRTGWVVVRVLEKEVQAASPGVKPAAAKKPAPGKDLVLELTWRNGRVHGEKYSIQVDLADLVAPRPAAAPAVQADTSSWPGRSLQVNGVLGRVTGVEGDAIVVERNDGQKLKWKGSTLEGFSIGRHLGHTPKEAEAEARRLSKLTGRGAGALKSVFSDLKSGVFTLKGPLVSVLGADGSEIGALDKELVERLDLPRRLLYVCLLPQQARLGAVWVSRDGSPGDLWAGETKDQSLFRILGKDFSLYRTELRRLVKVGEESPADGGPAREFYVYAHPAQDGNFAKSGLKVQAADLAQWPPEVREEILRMSEGASFKPAAKANSAPVTVRILLVGLDPAVQERLTGMFPRGGKATLFQWANVADGASARKALSDEGPWDAVLVGDVEGAVGLLKTIPLEEKNLPAVWLAPFSKEKDALNLRVPFFRSDRGLPDAVRLLQEVAARKKASPLGLRPGSRAARRYQEALNRGERSLKWGASSPAFWETLLQLWRVLLHGPKAARAMFVWEHPKVYTGESDAPVPLHPGGDLKRRMDELTDAVMAPFHDVPLWAMRLSGLSSAGSLAAGLALAARCLSSRDVFTAAVALTLLLASILFSVPILIPFRESRFVHLAHNEHAILTGSKDPLLIAGAQAPPRPDFDQAVAAYRALIDGKPVFDGNSGRSNQEALLMYDYEVMNFLGSLSPEYTIYPRKLITEAGKDPALFERWLTEDLFWSLALLSLQVREGRAAEDLRTVQSLLDELNRSGRTSVREAECLMAVAFGRTFNVHTMAGRLERLERALDPETRGRLGAYLAAFNAHHILWATRGLSTPSAHWIDYLQMAKGFSWMMEWRGLSAPRRYGEKERRLVGNTLLLIRAAAPAAFVRGKDWEGIEKAALKASNLSGALSHLMDVTAREGPSLFRETEDLDPEANPASPLRIAAETTKPLLNGLNDAPNGPSLEDVYAGAGGDPAAWMPLSKSARLASVEDAHKMFLEARRDLKGSAAAPVPLDFDRSAKELRALLDRRSREPGRSDEDLFWSLASLSLHIRPERAREDLAAVQSLLDELNRSGRPLVREAECLLAAAIGRATDPEALMDWLDWVERTLPPEPRGRVGAYLAAFNAHHVHSITEGASTTRSHWNDYLQMARGFAWMMEWRGRLIARKAYGGREKALIGNTVLLMRWSAQRVFVGEEDWDLLEGVATRKGVLKDAFSRYRAVMAREGTSLFRETGDLNPDFRPVSPLRFQVGTTKFLLDELGIPRPAPSVEDVYAGEGADPDAWVLSKRNVVLFPPEEVREAFLLARQGMPVGFEGAAERLRDVMSERPALLERLMKEQNPGEAFERILSQRLGVPPESFNDNIPSSVRSLSALFSINPKDGAAGRRVVGRAMDVYLLAMLLRLSERIQDGLERRAPERYVGLLQELLNELNGPMGAGTPLVRDAETLLVLHDGIAGTNISSIRSWLRWMDGRLPLERRGKAGALLALFNGLHLDYVPRREKARDKESTDYVQMLYGFKWMMEWRADLLRRKLYGPASPERRLIGEAFLAMRAADPDLFVRFDGSAQEMVAQGLVLPKEVDEFQDLFKWYRRVLAREGKNLKAETASLEPRPGVPSVLSLIVQNSGGLLRDLEARSLRADVPSVEEFVLEGRGAKTITTLSALKKFDDARARLDARPVGSADAEDPSLLGLRPGSVAARKYQAALDRGENSWRTLWWGAVFPSVSETLVQYWRVFWQGPEAARALFALEHAEVYTGGSLSPVSVPPGSKLERRLDDLIDEVMGPFFRMPAWLMRVSSLSFVGSFAAGIVFIAQAVIGQDVETGWKAFLALSVAALWAIGALLPSYDSGGLHYARNRDALRARSKSPLLLKKASAPEQKDSFDRGAEHLRALIEGKASFMDQVMQAPHPREVFPIKFDWGLGADLAPGWEAVGGQDAFTVLTGRPRGNSAEERVLLSRFLDTALFDLLLGLAKNVPHPDRAVVERRMVSLQALLDGLNRTARPGGRLATTAEALLVLVAGKLTAEDEIADWLRRMDVGLEKSRRGRVGAMLALSNGLHLEGGDLAAARREGEAVDYLQMLYGFKWMMEWRADLLSQGQYGPDSPERRLIGSALLWMRLSDPGVFISMNEKAARSVAVNVDEGEFKRLFRDYRRVLSREGGRLFKETSALNPRSDALSPLLLQIDSTDSLYIDLRGGSLDHDVPTFEKALAGQSDSFRLFPDAVKKFRTSRQRLQSASGAAKGPRRTSPIKGRLFDGASLLLAGEFIRWAREALGDWAPLTISLIVEVSAAAVRAVPAIMARAYWFRGKVAGLLPGRGLSSAAAGAALALMAAGQTPAVSGVFLRPDGAVDGPSVLRAAAAHGEKPAFKDAFRRAASGLPAQDRDPRRAAEALEEWAASPAVKLTEALSRTGDVEKPTAAVLYIGKDNLDDLDAALKASAGRGGAVLALASGETLEDGRSVEDALRARLAEAGPVPVPVDVKAAGAVRALSDLQAPAGAWLDEKGFKPGAVNLLLAVPADFARDYGNLSPDGIFFLYRAALLLGAVGLARVVEDLSTLARAVALAERMA